MPHQVRRQSPGRSAGAGRCGGVPAATVLPTCDSVATRFARTSASSARSTPSSNSAAVMTDTAISSGSSPDGLPDSRAMNTDVSAIAFISGRRRPRLARGQLPEQVLVRRRLDEDTSQLVRGDPGSALGQMGNDVSHRYAVDSQLQALTCLNGCHDLCRLVSELAHRNGPGHTKTVATTGGSVRRARTASRPDTVALSGRRASKRPCPSERTSLGLRRALHRRYG